MGCPKGGKDLGEEAGILQGRSVGECRNLCQALDWVTGFAILRVAACISAGLNEASY